MEQTVKKKFGIRDIMTIAAMMVINFATPAPQHQKESLAVRCNPPVIPR